MKKTVLLLALGLAGFGVAAQEVGRVVSTVPVVQQVAVPRQVCSQAVVATAPQTSGGGGLIGGLAGAGIGSQIGHGTGTAAAMVVGTLAGALIGNSIEAQGAARTAVVPQCTTQTSYENRTVGYNVTYEYAGSQQTVQLPYDPGPTIQLSGGVPVAQAGAPVVAPPIQSGVPVAQQGVPVGAPPVAVVPQPAPVAYAGYPAYPAYPAYAPAYPAYPAYAPAYPAYPVYPAYRPYYPPVGVSLGFVFSGGGGHHHRRWR